MDDITAPHIDMSSLMLDPLISTWAPPAAFSDFSIPEPPPSAVPHRQKRFGGGVGGGGGGGSMGAMREMIFRIAAMQPIHIDPEAIKAPRRRNVRISKDPQSVAARQRRERISQKIRILQRLVPGGTKMDTASMLDEAVHYVKFLKRQLQTLQQTAAAATTSFTTTNNNIINNNNIMNNCANNINFSYSSALLKASHLQFPPPMAANSSSLQMH